MPTPVATDRALRWGIVGAGRIAARVGADIAATAGNVVHAVAARDLDRAAGLAATLGADTGYGTYTELVTDPAVDVVYVATTHDRHVEHARLALGAGKPVLVEKPVALNHAGAVRLFDEAARQDLFCMEAMWMRLNPLVRRAQQIVQTGGIGDVRSVRAGFSFRVDYDPSGRLFDLAVGGGALLDLGVYPATLAWMFLGPPDSVATTGWLAPTGADAMAAMQWGYLSGRFAHLTCATLVAGSSEAVVTGTEGWITLIGPPFIRPVRIEVDRGDGTVEVHTADRPGSGYGPQVEEVARCLRAGVRESPLVPWSDTIGILGVLDEARGALGVRYSVD